MAGLAPCRSLLAALLPTPLLLALPLAPTSAAAEVQLRCEGTLLEARGTVERERPIQRLRVSLAVEAEERGSDGALALLQERLAAVRGALRGLEVKELRVSSPSTWQRPDSGRRPGLTRASLQVSGLLAPAQLQPLVRQVGSLPGVRLAPVIPEADPARERDTRRALLAAAYQRALMEAREVATAVGLTQLRPLEVSAEGGEAGPMPAPAPAAFRSSGAPPPPFQPGELPLPRASASMLVRFCAR
ncbi:MAG: SIMPL domain-containing protein [Cyanobacteriota bacterium]|nr:SIMPL domain-containing protein [Cyanobacteriota bacterium]